MLAPRSNSQNASGARLIDGLVNDSEPCHPRMHTSACTRRRRRGGDTAWWCPSKDAAGAAGVNKGCILPESLSTCAATDAVARFRCCSCCCRRFSTLSLHPRSPGPKPDIFSREIGLFVGDRLPGLRGLFGVDAAAAAAEASGASDRGMRPPAARPPPPPRSWRRRPWECCWFGECPLLVWPDGTFFP